MGGPACSSHTVATGGFPPRPHRPHTWVRCGAAIVLRVVSEIDEAQVEALPPCLI
jgi:hypothetical protein